MRKLIAALGLGALLVLVSLGFSSPALCGEDESPADAGISANLQQLVQQLGDENFRVRDLAVSKLEESGLAARDALLKGLEHEDPEVRFNCRQILSVILELDYQRRLRAFIDDKELKQDHGLAGWAEFKKTVGAGPAERDLFVAMHRAEPGLMESLDTGPKLLKEAFAVRCQQVQAQMHSGQRNSGKKARNVGSFSALLFVGSQEDLDLDAYQSSMLYSIVENSPFQEMMKKGSHVAPLRTMLSTWLKRGLSGSSYRGLRLALTYKLDVGLPLALRELKNRASGTNAAYAIMAVTKLGGKKYARALVPLLENDNTCWTWHRNNQIIKTQIRDVALAGLVHVTGQQHKDYGWDLLQKDDSTLYSIYTLGFPEGPKREQALKKWRAWAKANADKIPEEVPEHPPLPDPQPQRAVIIQAQPNQGNVAQGVRGALEWMFGIKKDRQSVERTIEFGPADRLLKVRLSTAETLLQQRRYEEAVRLLVSLLERSGDQAVQQQLSIPLHRSLRAAADHLLRELPPAGRDVYELQQGIDARRVLEEAVSEGDIEKLTRCAQQYRHTRAGYQAAYLVGEYLMSQGDPLHAAAFFHLVQSGQAAKEFEPAASLRLAAAWAEAGMSSEASRVLEQLNRKLPAATVALRGEEVRVQPEALHTVALFNSTAPAHDAARSQWLMFRGGPRRNAVLAADLPHSQTEWEFTLNDPPVAAQLRELRQRHLQRDLTALGTTQPLVIGDLIVTRSASRVMAVDARTGQKAWHVRLDLWAERFGQAVEEQSPAAGDHFTASLDARMWDDLTYGTMSSDGRLLFGIEDLHFSSALESRRMRVLPDGRRYLDLGGSQTFNRLTAHDAESGKLRWEVGGPGETSVAAKALQLPAAGAFFLGPPLPLGERLFVLAAHQGWIRLLTLESATGNLLTSLRLARFEEASLLEPIRQRAGLSPSFAKGVLICPTSARQFYAIDIRTSDVLWAYTAMEDLEAEEPSALPRNVVQQRLDPNFLRQREGRWADSSITIVGHRVLLTPFDAERLYCLDLSSGALLWQRARADGLYIGGATADRVVVVNRSGIVAYRLADGQNAWPSDRSMFPLGAVPSGRGLLTGSAYLIPLTSGDIAGVDLSSGRLQRGAPREDGLIPGDLVAYDGSVISQRVDALERLKNLSERDAQFIKRLEQQPGDAEALVGRGEILLRQGHLQEAYQLLSRAIEAAPTEANRRLLLECLLEGLERDFPAFKAHQLQAEQHLAKLSDKDNALRSRIWRALAEGYTRQGEFDEALNNYLSLAELGDTTTELQAVSPALRVNLADWVQARLRDLRLKADERTVNHLDEMIDERLVAALESKDEAKMADFLRSFGAQRDTDLVRMELAQSLLKAGRFLPAEGHLQKLLESEDPALAAGAAAELAATYARLNHTEAAAAMYQLLASRWADQVCATGKTGRELMAALPEDGPIRQTLQPSSPWPEGHVQASDTKDRPRNRNYAFNLDLRGPRPAWLSDGALCTDQSGRSLTLSDPLGAQQASISLKSNTSSYISQVNREDFIWGAAHGHLLVVFHQDHVSAIDLLHGNAGQSYQPRLLWDESLTLKPISKSNVAAQRPNNQPRRTAGGAVVTHSLVCYQQQRTLKAVDPMTGKLLWSRHDLPNDCEVFGDERLVLVRLPGSDEARVFDPLDGAELGTRQLPTSDQRLMVLGRRLLQWIPTSEGIQVGLRDLLTDKLLWQRSVAAESRHVPVDGRFLAVLEPDGRFQLLQISDGEPAVVGTVKDAANVLNFQVLLSDEACFIITDEGAGEVQGNVRMVLNQFGQQSKVASGRVIALSRKEEKQLWTQKYENQALMRGQPSASPLLIFACQKYEQLGNNKQHTWRGSLLCINKLDGAVVYNDTSNGMLYGLTAQADPKNQRVLVGTSQKAVELKYTGEKKKDDEAAKNKPNEESASDGAAKEQFEDD